MPGMVNLYLLVVTFTILKKKELFKDTGISLPKSSMMKSVASFRLNKLIHTLI